jgi:hypothetical protein
MLWVVQVGHDVCEDSKNTMGREGRRCQHDDDGRMRCGGREVARGLGVEDDENDGGFEIGRFSSVFSPT